VNIIDNLKISSVLNTSLASNRQECYKNPYFNLGRVSGGLEPISQVSGTRAAFPAPPPDQFNIVLSQSMPYDLIPPTLVGLTSVPSFNVAPSTATTTLSFSATLGADVTTVIILLFPMSTVTTFSLSLPIIASQEIIKPTTKGGEARSL